MDLFKRAGLDFEALKKQAQARDFTPVDSGLGTPGLGTRDSGPEERKSVELQVATPRSSESR
ncbi:hypothetical protein, partial [Xanthomonas translucens]|uniref:hypothetical protein n=1 Tax=Xanthomonas campestris pv. translucens TaxID=343 RepID=UPI002B406651